MNETWQIICPPLRKIFLQMRENSFLNVEVMNVKCNKPWLYSDRKCSVCKKHEETQAHMIECRLLMDQNNEMSYIPSRSELFSDNLDDKIYTVQVMRENIRKRD